MEDVRDEKRKNMPPAHQQDGDRGHLTILNYSEIYLMSKYHFLNIKKKAKKKKKQYNDVRVLLRPDSTLCRDALITVRLLSLRLKANKSHSEARQAFEALSHIPLADHAPSLFWCTGGAIIPGADSTWDEPGEQGCLGLVGRVAEHSPRASRCFSQLSGIHRQVTQT